MFEEALEDSKTESLANLGEAGMVRQGLVEAVADVPALGDVEGHGFHELALGAQPVKEEEELQLEKDNRINAVSSALSVLVGDPVADKAQIELCLEPAIEVVLRDELVKRGQHRPVKPAHFRWTQHDACASGGGGVPQRA